MPFEVRISEDTLKDLQRRLANVRLAPDDGKIGWKLGMNPTYLRELLEYWLSGFDWRAQERCLNALDHFTATVSGTRLHFVHAKGRGPAPLPLLLIHGFPDSFRNERGQS